MDLSAVASLGSAAEQEAEYTRLLEAAVERSDASGVVSVVEAALSHLPAGAFGGSLGRVLCARLSAASDNAFVYDACEGVVAALKEQGGAVEDVDWALRKLLFDIAVGDGNHSEAASVFVNALRVPLEERTFTLVRIAQCFLAAGDSGNADVYVRRAAESVEDDTPLPTLVMLRVCRARVQDARRNFESAAQLYVELSRVEGLDTDPMELLSLLEDAAVCAVLARPSPQRQRLLTAIARDSRAPSLQSFRIVDAAQKGRFLTEAHVRSFRPLLKEHHPPAVLERALHEHNILAASRIYRNVALPDLAALVGVEEDRCEAMAAAMIASGALQGASIDQVAGTVAFGADTDPVAAWDKGLDILVRTVAKTAEEIAQKHPKLAADME